ncbi:MAG: membrane protein insertion efficiency factor YidD [Zetaproteobacteria bacterium]|nr:membrane protein insertion efficiency factor YidD [Zetaproteobacteria bacterium]
MNRSLIVAIRWYQRWLSPSLGSVCRFHPSCSEYAIFSLKKYPIYKAVPRIILRILKCNPYHPGGVDFP